MTYNENGLNYGIFCSTHRCFVEKTNIPSLHQLKEQHLWALLHHLIVLCLICSALLLDHCLMMLILDIFAYNGMDLYQEGTRAQATRMRRRNHWEEVKPMKIQNLWVQEESGMSPLAWKNQKNIPDLHLSSQQLNRQLDLHIFILLLKMKMSAQHVLKVCCCFY